MAHNQYMDWKHAFGSKNIIGWATLALLAGCQGADSLTNPKQSDGGLICLINSSAAGCPETLAAKCSRDPTASGCYDASDPTAVLALAHHVQIESTSSGNANVTTSTLSAGQTQTFYLAAYDAQSEYLGQVVGVWSVANALGTITAGSVSSATFTAGAITGTEVVTATTSSGLADSTGNISVLGALSTIKISSATGAGAAAYETSAITTDSSVTLYALGFDAGNNYLGTVNVDWSFTNDKGSFASGSDVNTVSAASSVTFYANLATSAGNHAVIHAVSGAITDDTGTTAAGIQITLGALASLKIRSAAANGGSEYNTATINTDQSVTLYAAGYDADGNYLGDTSVAWSFTNDKGSFAAGVDTNTVAAASSATFYANQLTFINDHAVIHITSGAITDDTGTISSGIQIQGGALAALKIRTAASNGGSEYNSDTLTADQSVALYAASYDADGNYIGDMNVNWSFVNDKGSFASGSDTNTSNGVSTVTFYANVTTSAGNHGVIRITSGAITDDTGTVASGIQVNAGAMTSLKITDAISPSANEITTDFVMPQGPFKVFAISYDADGNYRGGESVSWTMANNNGSFSASPATNSVFTANDVIGSEVITATSGVITDSTGTLTIGVPAPAGAMIGVTKLCSGGYFSCALVGSNVRCWGANATQGYMSPVSKMGQLGNNNETILASAIPLTVQNFGGGALTNATDVACGKDFACALINDGTVKCWGNNSSGQLGDGTTTTQNSAVTVLTAPATNLTTANAITAGDAHTCAKVNEGGSDKMRCWGNNGNAQLGIGGGANQSYATTVLSWLAIDFTGVTTIAAGSNFTCASLNDQTARCWGDAGSGKLGNNQTAGTYIYADQVVRNAADGNTLTGITKVFAGPTASNGCAIVTTGEAYCWGENWFGVVGWTSGLYLADQPQAKKVTTDGATALANVKSISVGNYSACATAGERGEMKCWGNNWLHYANRGCASNCGAGGIADSYVVDADGTTSQKGVALVSAGNDFSCAAFKTSNFIECWGNNESRQLGSISRDASSTSDRAYSAVQDSYAVAHSDLANISNVSIGANSACAVNTGGTVQCWGQGGWGEIGNVTKTMPALPSSVVKVSGGANLTGVSDVEVGTNFACALLADESVQCWGRNSSGYLGNVFVSDSNFAVTAHMDAGGTTPLDGVASISGSGTHTCATMMNGEMRCWGYAFDGGLGRGNGVTQSYYAGLVETSLGVSLTATNSALSAGSSQSCVIMANSEVRCWGLDNTGQLGNNNTVNLYYASDKVQDVGTTPVTNISKISTFGYNTCGLLSDQRVNCWGTRSNYSLGDNSTAGTVGYAGNFVSNGGGDLSNVTDIAVGQNAACAIYNAGAGDNRVRCWGDGDFGQMGDNAYSDNPVADTDVVNADLTTLTDAASIDAYDRMFCVRTTAGKVKCWGEGIYGRIFVGKLEDGIFATAQTIKE